MVKLDRKNSIRGWLFCGKYMGSEGSNADTAFRVASEKAFRASRGELMRYRDSMKNCRFHSGSRTGKYDQWVERELKWIARRSLDTAVYGR